MSPPHTVVAGGQSYLVVDDITTVFQALICGALTDETTGSPLRGLFTVRANRPDVYVRGLDGGLFVAAVYPEQLPLPAIIELTFSAAGYRDLTISVPVPLNPVLPVDVGTVALRPFPVRLQGRVVENTASRSPIASASVAVQAANSIAVRTPLRFVHAAGVTVRERVLNPAGAAKILTVQARGGDTLVTLNNTSGIVAGSLLRFGPDTDTEYATVGSLGNAPGELLLAAPLTRTFAAGATAQRVTKGAVGASTTLARSADPGDGLLRLNAPLAGPAIEVLDGSNSEYAVLNALTDANGFYRLDGIGELRSIELRASATGFTDLLAPWTLDFAQPVNFVNFRLSP